MATDLALTDHAGKRLQQRGIRPKTVDVLLAYGTVEFDHCGACIYYLDKRGRRRLESDWGHDGARQAESLDGIYAVVSTEGTVVTVGHLRRRVFHDRKRGSHPRKRSS